MLRKNCHVCGNASYSANERGSWPCPYCNTDLAKERIMSAIESKPTQAVDQSMKTFLLQNESLKRET